MDKHRMPGLESRGFSLVELMTVVAIVALLTAIALPQFTAYKQRGFAATVRADLRSSYTAAQGFFSDSPNGLVTTTLITQYGFSTAETTFTVAGFTQAALSISATCVRDSEIHGTIDANGNINGVFSH